MTQKKMKKHFNLNAMKKFHICYYVAKELCTGININAASYVEAIKEFIKTHDEKKIIYVSELIM